MHNAGTIAGMAFGNAFLGIVHAMAHTIGATFHLAHGRTNATLLPHVIRYNGTVPTKLTGWPKYETLRRAGALPADRPTLGLPAATDAEEGVESYAHAVEQPARRGRHPSRRSGRRASTSRPSSPGAAAQAHERLRDQCAPANPRMPMLGDMKDLMRAAYYGPAAAACGGGAAASPSRAEGPAACGLRPPVNELGWA